MLGLASSEASPPSSGPPASASCASNTLTHAHRLKTTHLPLLNYHKNPKTTASPRSPPLNGQTESASSNHTDHTHQRQLRFQKNALVSTSSIFYQLLETIPLFFFSSFLTHCPLALVLSYSCRWQTITRRKKSTLTIRQQRTTTTSFHHRMHTPRLRSVFQLPFPPFLSFNAFRLPQARPGAPASCTADCDTCAAHRAMVLTDKKVKENQKKPAPAKTEEAPAKTAETMARLRFAHIYASEVISPAFPATCLFSPCASPLFGRVR